MSAQVTEAHLHAAANALGFKTVADANYWGNCSDMQKIDKIAQLIADSEAAAVEAALLKAFKEIMQQIAEIPPATAALTAERDQLRAELQIQEKLNKETIHGAGALAESHYATIKQLRAENNTLRAAQKSCEDCDAPTNAEAARLRAEVERLKQDAEIEFERRNEQQQMDNESANRDIALFKSRAERAEAELAKERARSKVLLDLVARCLIAAGESESTVRAAIDAAMKEDGK